MLRSLLALSLSLPVLLAEPPKFPEPYDSEKAAGAIMSARDAAASFKVPPGFRVEVFAAEPDVRNPIGCCWDTKGRLWVAENYTYAESKLKFDLNLRDRVIILHDKNGDNKPERKVFCENVQRLTSVEVGLGGVWLMTPPQLLFIPDKNGDDIPDGPPEVVLEGFDVPAENHHNFANGLKWGPDGWLYGRCGASAPGKVRRPDQGPDAAVPLAGGIWRYHPTRKVFEALCHGTTNPWGHDWDEFGNCFFINTVNGHLWQMIPGAHYERPHTRSPNPLVYEPMKQIADHYHFDTGKGWVDSRKVDPTVDKLGGGHAHIGMMIYNGDQWPKEYRGKVFTCNMHGRRINVDRLERQGSGFVGKHEPDFAFAADPHFRGMELSQGPDGSVYVLDWHDAGECHDHTGVLRSTGRIYRISYGNFEPQKTPDLSKQHVNELVRNHTGRNEWRVRQSRIEMRNRYYINFDYPYWLEAQKEMLPLLKDASITTRIHAIHTLASMNGLHDDERKRLVSDSDPNIQVYLIKLLSRDYNQELDYANCIHPSTPEFTVRDKWNNRHLVEYYERFNNAPSHLAYASAMMRSSVDNRFEIASNLSTHAEYASDANIPLLVWYGLIPIAMKYPEKLTDLAAASKLPQIRKWTARRFAEIVADKPACLNDLLGKTAAASESVRGDVVQGMTEGLAGVRKVPMPANWKAFTAGLADPALLAKVRTLDVIFGDGRALDEVKKLALDDKADLQQRKAAVLSLVDANPPELREVCEKLLRVRFLNVAALKGLVKFDDAGPVIAKAYGSFHPSERSHVVAALASRPSFAAVLVAEMAAGRIKPADVSASQARQIAAFDKPDLTAALSKAWGELRESPKDKLDLIAKWKKDLTPETLKNADASAGRVIFAKTCASCHKLYGQGEAIGPDLTGAGRKDMDYLLMNIVDPSAVVTKDYMVTIFKLADGRSLTGIIAAETPTTLTLQLEKEKLTVLKADIEKQTPSKLSLMPDGQLQTLKDAEVRNLIKYLMTDSQVELPK